ncbi:hypothetical protein Zmor_008373 [Zophobas morio]|uniref:Fibrinogen C-terminal domain-containing protein n=1 Tax=Zophobas morio TaxID=2755281 RepID=A0AA38IWE6_9CUCU|nr:hypothetical protein Zmor_008373 [Zophobas morio]
MKMVHKSFFTVCLFLNLLLFSCEDDQENVSKTLFNLLYVSLHQFDVGSTTQLPPDFLRIEQALNKQAENVKQSEELEILDSAKTLNLEQVINRLENLESTINLKLEKLTHRLQIFESTKAAQLEQLTRRIDAIESTKTSNLEQLTHLLESLETTNNLKSEELKRRLDALESANNLKLEQLTNRLKPLESKNEMSLCLSVQTEWILPRNCREVKERGCNVSTTYLIKPEFAPRPIKVLCDLEKKEGGWTYILNRFDGSQSFDFDMEEYETGFGKLSGEFWLGLENIHYLTGYENNELLVELVDWNETSVFAHYNRFRVGSEHKDYLMTVSGYDGTAGDSFYYMNNTKFGTKKIDFDHWPSGSCAQKYDASWWFKYCHNSLLTGKYLKGDVPSEQKGKIMYWYTFRGNTYSLKEARMMVRPRIEANDGIPW